MALIDDVIVVCHRLAPLGWRSLLLEVTGGQLDILKPTSAVIKTDLTETLTAIDRIVTRFIGFSFVGTPANTDGSLLSVE